LPVNSGISVRNLSEPTVPNRLIHSASPYLRQHAHNPVDWYPWGPEALLRARTEDKPMLVSIGYSACHWCHVMERESFENPELARMMNEHFVCIKVDREERPDIDQVYMEAAHAMGLQGGWPLNVFVTPDQKPFYGGTYFRPGQWKQVLHGIAQAYRENRSQLLESAQEFTRAVAQDESERYGLKAAAFSAGKEEILLMVDKLRARFDREQGGLDRAPKFPNPSIWMFLLHAALLLRDSDLDHQIALSLDRMAAGGICDQVGGGFARYSVDRRWFAPHFEKMLYDNAQLISLYARAYQHYRRPEYRRVVYETISFAERELLHYEGGYYAALDADSEGVEGRYYVWSHQEFADVLGAEAALMADYFGITEEGNWEEGMNILTRRHSTAEFAASRGLDPEDLENRVAIAAQALRTRRDARVRPGLDDKLLAGWNGLMLTGLADAYAVFGEAQFLEHARNNAAFIEKRLLQPSGGLRRTAVQDGGGIPAYLEDYAAVIQGLCALYQVGMEERWLMLAHNLMEYAIDQFLDGQNGMFFFTARDSEQLIARKKEIFDSVIPSSNSMMAANLYRLGLLFDKTGWLDLAGRHLAAVLPLLRREPQYLSNWANLYTSYAYPTAEIAVAGPEAGHEILALEQRYFPNKVTAAATAESHLPLLEHRKPVQAQTTIYVCYGKTCKLPVHSAQQALKQIEEAVAMA
jgi:uncharacterized protein